MDVLLFFVKCSDQFLNTLSSVSVDTQISWHDFVYHKIP